MGSSFYKILTEPRAVSLEGSVIEDIEQHLTALLNARQWMLSTDHEYGLPDICAETTAAYADLVLNVTRDLITRYEPRLSIRSISYDKTVKHYNQLTIRILASLSDNALIELRAKLGGQRSSTVTRV